MKPWQHGYALDYLKSLELMYGEYNEKAASPFAQFKKNNIAEALHKQELEIITLGQSMAHVTTSKVSTPVTMHGDVVLGMKLPGDVTIKHLIGNMTDILLFLDTMRTKNVWFHSWATDLASEQAALQTGFSYVGAKITSFGEVFSIWFRGSCHNLAPRSVNGMPPEDRVHIKKLWDVDPILIEGIKSSLQNNLIKFANHYSNYNIKNAWSAFALRGYSADPLFIAKPIEMSKKWKEEHANDHYEMQDTPLRKLFPEVEELIRPLDGDIHRIRLMRLSPGGGELGRHTDQVDPDAGNGLGKLARLHWPIITAPEVVFTVWNHKDVRTDANMKVGECWMLDTRKPHKVYNGSPIARIHLVIDTIVTPKLLDIIRRSE